MGSFKSLKRSNVFLTDYLSKKSWTITGSEFEGKGIRILTWKSGSLPYYPKEDEKVDGYYPQLAYREAKQAYFDGMQSDGSVSGSRDLNLQTTITISSSRKLEAEYAVISIPKSCFGINIDESSLELNIQGTRLTDKEGKHVAYQQEESRRNCWLLIDKTKTTTISINKVHEEIYNFLVN